MNPLFIVKVWGKAAFYLFFKNLVIFQHYLPKLHCGSTSLDMSRDCLRDLIWLLKPAEGDTFFCKAGHRMCETREKQYSGWVGVRWVVSGSWWKSVLPVQAVNSNAIRKASGNPRCLPGVRQISSPKPRSYLK